MFKKNHIIFFLFLTTMYSTIIKTSAIQTGRSESCYDETTRTLKVHFQLPFLTGEIIRPISYEQFAHLDKQINKLHQAIQIRMPGNRRSLQVLILREGQPNLVSTVELPNERTFTHEKVSIKTFCDEEYTPTVTITITEASEQEAAGSNQNNVCSTMQAVLAPLNLGD